MKDEDALTLLRNLVEFAYQDVAFAGDVDMAYARAAIDALTWALGEGTTQALQNLIDTAGRSL